MTRETAHTLKRTMRAGLRADACDSDCLLSRNCALALLRRSIDWGHARLAVIRLAMAVDAGARVPREHWAYCLRMAQASRDVRLQDIYRSAAIKGSTEDLQERW